MGAEEQARRIMADVGQAIVVTDLKPGQVLSVDVDLPEPQVMRHLLRIHRPSECPNHPHPDLGVCILCGVERVSALRVIWHVERDRDVPADGA